MKIAVTCENDTVFQHFGHTPAFMIYTTEGGKIVSSEMLSCGDSGHGALAGLLYNKKVDVLICGGIGGGAINALRIAGIQVIGGAEGNVQSVTEAFLSGTLTTRQNFHCNHHHGDDHNCKDHSCGEHSCGGNCSH